MGGKSKTKSVKVLTAGGAASTGRKNGQSDPRRNKPKEVDLGVDEGLLTRTSNNDKTAASAASIEYQSESSPPSNTAAEAYSLEFEASERGLDGTGLDNNDGGIVGSPMRNNNVSAFRPENEPVTPIKVEDLYQEPPQSSKAQDLFWLFLCFIGIMASFVCYGLLLEYTTSGGRKLHELSFLFVTSGLYTLTAAAGRYVRGETPSTIPPPRFAILGLTSMGSTFTSVRSLR
jgi:hypothetical protein